MPIDHALATLANLPLPYQQAALAHVHAPKALHSITELIAALDGPRSPMQPPELPVGGPIGRRIDQYLAARDAYNNRNAAYRKTSWRRQRLDGCLDRLSCLVDEVNVGFGADLAAVADLLDATPDDLAATAKHLAAAASQRQQADLTTNAHERDPRWQRRRLRTAIKRTRVQLDAVLRRVGGRKGQTPYASAETERAWQDQQARNVLWAEAHSLVGNGAKVSMATVIEAWREARLAQTYAQVQGLEAIMRRMGWVPMFLTLTLPPEWHPSPLEGASSWDPERGPVAARIELGLRWAHIRRAVRRDGIAWCGLIIKESHKDGCPHAHALAYVRPDDVKPLLDILSRYAPGRQSHAVEIDRSRASPSTYVWKYLVKSLNDPMAAAAEVAKDSQSKKSKIGGEDQLSHFAAHTAWASALGQRRWAFFGLRPGTVTAWRMVYQAAQRESGPEGERGPWRDPAVGKLDGGHLKRCITYCDRSRWGLLLLQLGALSTRRRVVLVREARIQPDGKVSHKYTGIADAITGEMWACPTWVIERSDKAIDATDADANLNIKGLAPSCCELSKEEAAKPDLYSMTIDELRAWFMPSGVYVSAHTPP